jgi:hypothetical protein
MIHIPIRDAQKRNSDLGCPDCDSKSIPIRAVTILVKFLNFSCDWFIKIHRPINIFDLMRMSERFPRSIFGYLTAMVHHLSTFRARLRDDHNVWSKRAMYGFSNNTTICALCISIYNKLKKQWFIYLWYAKISYWTTDLPQVTHKLYQIMLYSSPWAGVKPTTSAVTGTGSCQSIYHKTTPRRPLCLSYELTWHVEKQIYFSNLTSSPCLLQ